MIYVFSILATLAIALIINGLMQPKIFSISRSISLNKTPANVYPLIEDLKHWDSWSPWAEKDPGMKKDFSEPSSGPGAFYSWHGNKEVGQGKMTIIETEQDKSISIELDIKKPFEAHNQVFFSLQDSGPGKQAENHPSNNLGTLATWSMSGRQNFFMRAMSLFLNMDKMVGSDFETGLRSLKALVED